MCLGFAVVVLAVVFDASGTGGWDAVAQLRKESPGDARPGGVDVLHAIRCVVVLVALCIKHSLQDSLNMEITGEQDA